MNLRPVKACHACGASFTLASWQNLRPYTGPAIPSHPGSKLRLCHCATVLALDTEAAASVADALPPPTEEPEP